MLFSTQIWQHRNVKSPAFIQTQQFHFPSEHVSYILNSQDKKQYGKQNIVSKREEITTH